MNRNTEEGNPQVSDQALQRDSKKDRGGTTAWGSGPGDQGGSNREHRKQCLSSLIWGIWVEVWLRAPRRFQILGGQQQDQPEKDILRQVGEALFMKTLMLVRLSRTGLCQQRPETPAGHRVSGSALADGQERGFLLFPFFFLIKLIYSRRSNEELQRAFISGNLLP